VVAACEEALEAPEGLDPALALCSLALQILAGRGVAASSGDSGSGITRLIRSRLMSLVRSLTSVSR
jgi:hypothetical protein